MKDLLNKQKGHMNKIRAFLTARPSEPRRGHVRGTWKDRMGRPASSHVLWTAMTVTSHRSLNGQDPFVQFGVVLCMGVTFAYVFFIWSVRIGSGL